MNYTVDGDVAQLQFNSSPKIQIDISKDPVEISIRVDMTAVALTVMPDIERLRSQFEQDMLSTFQHCQALGVDPFGFAESRQGNSSRSISGWNTIGMKSFLRRSFLWISASIKAILDISCCVV